MGSALQALQQGGANDVQMVFNDDNQCQAFLNTCPSFKAEHAFVASIPDISEGSATQIRNQYLEWGDASPETLTQDLQKTLNLHPGVHQVIVENNCYRASKKLTGKKSSNHGGHFFDHNEKDDASVGVASVCHKTPKL